MYYYYFYQTSSLKTRCDNNGDKEYRCTISHSCSFTLESRSSFRLVSDPRLLLGALSYPRCALDTEPPPSPPRFCPHRAELDAHRHNRWYSTTDRRSARISRRTTFLSQNFTGTSRIIGAGGGFTEDKLDFDGPWILRLEAEFGVWVSCDGFFSV